MVILGEMESFVREVAATPGGQHVLSCIQCGTCSGSCPMAGRMEYLPRKLIALIRAGMREEVLSSSSAWFCLSCYLCTCRCPRGVKPTELAHALESLAERYGYRVKGTLTPKMYHSFVGSIKGNGRVHEFGMMLRFYLTQPVVAVKALPLGLKLFLRHRLSLTPKKMKCQQDLLRITQKFKEVRGAN